MECRDIHRLLRDAHVPEGPSVDAHLSTCDACRSVCEASSGLKRALANASTSQSRDVEDLWRFVQRDVAAERGPRAWASSQPSWRRWLVACLVALGLVVSVGWFSPRPDLDAFADTRSWLILSLLLTCVFGLSFVALTSPLRARTGTLGWIRSRTAITAAIAASVLIALACLPEAHTDHPASLLGVDDDLARRAAACFMYGSVSILPFLLVLALVDRREARPSPTLMLGVIVGGLLGNVTLLLHCSLTASIHLLLGHATLGLAAFVVVSIAMLRAR